MSGRLSKIERETLRDRFTGRCGYCGGTLGERWHADHVEPVIREARYERGKGYVQTGAMLRPHLDTFENRMPACAPCNISKGSHGLESWRLVLSETLAVLRRNYPLYRTALRLSMVAEVTAPVVFFFETLKPQDPQ